MRSDLTKTSSGRGQGKKSGFQVTATRCDQCLFSKDRIVDGKRMASVLKQCRENDSHFICHKFTIEDEDSQVCCRGFYETQPPTQLMRIAGRLGCITEVELPT